MNKSLIATVAILIVFASTICMCVQSPIQKPIQKNISKNISKNVSSPSKIPSAKELRVSTLVLKNKGEWCAVVTITLPNTCYRIKYNGIKKSGNNFILNFTYTKSSNICTQVIVKYNKTICFGKLPKGNYTVYVVVNGIIKNKVPLIAS